MNIETLKQNVEAQLEETYNYMVEYGEQEGLEDPTRSKFAAEGYDYEAGFFDGLKFVHHLLGQLDNPLDAIQNRQEEIQSEYTSLKEALTDKAYVCSNPDALKELSFLDGRLEEIQHLLEILQNTPDEELS